MENSNRKTHVSSLVKKWLMALTGLFLCIFLVVHLLGNLQLFMPAVKGQEAFNSYSKFMTSNPLIKTVSYLLYASIILHALVSLWLTIQNRKARPVRYAKNTPSANSTWSSRNMGILGTIILVFIIIHMKNFWYEMHWGNMPIDPWGNKDLYTITVAAFREIWYVVLYVFSMAAIAFHLVHGFASAFQTLGLRNKKYYPLISGFGWFFSLTIPTAFAAIPVYIYFNSL